MASNDRLLVQLASYNTNLQGENGVPQNLVEWLAPTLQVSTFLSHEHRAPDIFAVGFQELLPLYLGLPGFSQKVLDSRNKLILSELEKHAPNKERYTLVSRIANVGVALLVYVRDDKLANRVMDVQTQWTGCGFGGYMGNKGAVGIRFRLQGESGQVGETFTFVCAHLTPHEHNLKARLRDWRHIVGTLLFPPVSESSKEPSIIYDTSHLFVFGDMNFRVALPADHQHKQTSRTPQFADILESHAERENIKDHDQLLVERQKGNVFVGLREGNFWNFKCSYKYLPGEVDAYSSKRAPSWTDRIMYTTYTDDPDQPDVSTITNVLYTSIPSYTISDHKPVVAIVMLPPSQPITGSSPPLLRLPASYSPKPYPRATLMRYIGRAMDRVIGSVLFLLTLVGAGNAIIGIANFIGGLGAFAWWRSSGRISLV